MYKWKEWNIKDFEICSQLLHLLTELAEWSFSSSSLPARLREHSHVEVVKRLKTENMFKTQLLRQELSWEPMSPIEFTTQCTQQQHNYCIDYPLCWYISWLRWRLMHGSVSKFVLIEMLPQNTHYQGNSMNFLTDQIPQIPNKNRVYKNIISSSQTSAQKLHLPVKNMKFK